MTVIDHPSGSDAAVPARLGARRAVALLVALAACTAGGCSLTRRTPDTRYYTLAVSGSPPSPLPAPLRVGAFTADQPYATARFAFRTSPYRLEYYTYHRWAADPRVVVATAARDYLERAAVAGSGVPLELTGNIRRLEEVDDASGWQGALALDVRIARDGTVVLERSYADTEPAEARNPEAVVAALSRALGRILDRALADVPEASDATTGRAPAVCGR